ncbi:DNA-binding response regulator [Brevibacterium sp.]|uniref:AAA family ATPase n=1 Tax=Brevibacterium sp. TaxID=1701 RepID=UPI002811B488|nr:DNA-binding response regulator [Brevibacterium sp.]
MTQVVLAVDFELDLILFELLSEIEDVTTVARPADDVELLAHARTGGADVAVVGQYFPGLDADVVAAITATGTKVLGFGNDADALGSLGVTRSIASTADSATMRAGLDEVLHSTLVPPRPSRPPGPERGAGRILTVWGTGSSPGRTATAVNLGDHAARQGHRTVIVDADTVSAMVATSLGLTEESSHLASLCRREAEKNPPVDVEDVPHAVISADLHAVTGLTRADRWPEVRAGTLTAVLNRLATMYDLVIVDVSDRCDPDDEFADPFYDRHCATRAALDAADTVLVLAAGDPIGLQRLVRLLGTERAERIREKSRLAITKVRAGAVGHRAEDRIREVLTRFLSAAPDFVFSDDRSGLDAAMLAGLTLHEANPRSQLSREFAEAVEELVPARTRSRRHPGTPDSGRRGAGRSARRRLRGFGAAKS